MHKKDLRIVFMGTPDFAKASLEELINQGYNVVGVFTNPDKESGRGLKLNFSAVKEYSINNNIQVFQPIKLRNNPEVVEILKKLNPNLICVTAYGKILPIEVLDFPKYGCINVHGSLLPKYRGAAPIQWAIINSEKITGITTMLMDEGMDTGNMLLKEEVEILDSDNFLTLSEKLKIVGAKLLTKTVEKLIDNDGNLQSEKQPEGSSYAPMIEKEMSHIDFNKTPRQIFDLVRGLDGFIGTYFLGDNNKRYKVYSVKCIENKNIDTLDIPNGTIIYINKESLGIKCSGGIIEIIEIQPENSKRMKIDEFLRGSKFKVGDKLN